MTEIKLQAIPVKDKEENRVFLDQYLEELSAFGEFDLTYPFFDMYWQETDYWPYWIISGETKIGFIFVNQVSPFGNEVNYFLAEFYILPKYRKQGFGEAAFKEITSLHAGHWELAFFIHHEAAKTFWSKAVKDLPHHYKNHEKVIILQFET